MIFDENATIHSVENTTLTVVWEFPYAITGYTATCKIHAGTIESPGATLATPTCTVSSPNATVTLSASQAARGTLPAGNYWYEFVLYPGDGTVAYVVKSNWIHHPSGVGL